MNAMDKLTYCPENKVGSKLNYTFTAAINQKLTKNIYKKETN